MIDTDEKVDARTVEEDMETRNNMNWLNNRVVELEAEVERLRDAMEQAIAYVVQDYYVLKVLCKALGNELNPTRGEEE